MSTLEIPQPGDDNSDKNENIVQPSDDTTQEAAKPSEEWLEALGEPDGEDLTSASLKHLAARNKLIATFEELSAKQTIDEQQRAINKTSNSLNMQYLPAVRELITHYLQDLPTTPKQKESLLTWFADLMESDRQAVMAAAHAIAPDSIPEKQADIPAQAKLHVNQLYEESVEECKGDPSRIPAYFADDFAGTLGQQQVDMINSAYSSIPAASKEAQATEQPTTAKDDTPPPEIPTSLEIKDPKIARMLMFSEIGKEVIKGFAITGGVAGGIIIGNAVTHFFSRKK
jgi:hypothetical protein